MVTASKRWAIVSGFVITGVAIVVGAMLSRSGRPVSEPPSAIASQQPPVAVIASPREPASHPVPLDGGTAPQGTAQNGTGKDGTGKDGTGKDGTGKDGTAPKAGTAMAAAAIVDPDRASSEPAGGSGDPAARVPHFDVVRVEPNGDTVLAGQGAPNATIELVASGKVLAQASSDDTGHFVMLPPALAPGDYALTLRQPVDGTMVMSVQSVTVSVPVKGKGSVLVALAEPGQATRLLSPAPQPAAASAKVAAGTPPGLADATSSSGTHSSRTGTSGTGTSGTRTNETKTNETKTNETRTNETRTAGGTTSLAIRSVELENGNGFYASGVAAPGTKLRVYLNDSHLADVAAGGDAGWSVKIRKGLPGGHYVVRADASADGKTVTARVEVPFDVPVATPVAMAQPAAVAPVAGPASPAPAVPPRLASAGSPTVAVALASAGEGERGTLSVATGVAPGLGRTSGAEPAAAGPAAAPQPAVIASTATDAVIDEVKTAVVRTGDNLWDISRIRLGQGWRYTRIYAANAAQIRDPQLIYPGQVFVLPSQND